MGEVVNMVNFAPLEIAITKTEIEKNELMLRQIRPAGSNPDRCLGGDGNGAQNHEKHSKKQQKSGVAITRLPPPPGSASKHLMMMLPSLYV